jgi:polar amino acid transport system substrate-binding protein
LEKTFFVSHVLVLLATLAVLTPGRAQKGHPMPSFALRLNRRSAMGLSMVCASGFMPWRDAAADSSAPWRLIAGLVPPLCEPGGAIAALVARQLAGVGQITTPTWLPWARAYREAKSEGRALLFPLARTPEREQDWLWLSPLVIDEFVLLVRRDALRPDAGDARLRSLRVGVLNGSASGATLRRDGFVRVEVAPSEPANARKLAAGHLEAWATSRRVAEAPELSTTLARAGALRAVPLGSVSFWLAASNDLPGCARPAGWLGLTPRIDPQCARSERLTRHDSATSTPR